MKDYQKAAYLRYQELQEWAKEAEITPRVRRLWAYWLRGWLPEDKSLRIFDIAAGNGVHVKLFREWGYVNVAGIDLCPGFTCAGVFLADLFKWLPKHPLSYDVLLASSIFEHMGKERLHRCLKLCHESIRGNGTLIASVPNAMCYSFHRWEDITHEGGFTPKGIRDWLTLAGFGEVEIREVGLAPVYPLGIVRWVIWLCIRQWWKFLWHVLVGHDGGGIYTPAMLVKARKV